eukprot:m.66577 g.66577  ORF g.66577 m.66577 type:complete len:87 (+) comp11559_c0_seq1:228-488(+)
MMSINMINISVYPFFPCTPPCFPTHILIILKTTQAIKATKTITTMSSSMGGGVETSFNKIEILVIDLNSYLFFISLNFVLLTTLLK